MCYNEDIKYIFYYYILLLYNTIYNIRLWGRYSFLMFLFYLIIALMILIDNPCLNVWYFNKYNDMCYNEDIKYIYYYYYILLIYNTIYLYEEDIHF